MNDPQSIIAELLITAFVTLLATFLSTSGVAGIVLYWLKARLKAGIEAEYAQKLGSIQAENARALERIRADLQIKATENQIRFARTYDEMATVISKTYEFLSQIQPPVVEYTKSFIKPQESSHEERYDKVAEAFTRFDAYYASKKIFLPLYLAEEIDSCTGKISALIIEFQIMVQDKIEKEPAYYNDPEVLQKWSEIKERVWTDIPPILRDIDHKFRSLLGIPGERPEKEQGK